MCKAQKSAILKTLFHRPRGDAWRTTSNNE